MMRIASLALLAALSLSAGASAFAGQMVSTPARTIGAVMETRGFTIQPLGINPASADDLAPQQLFEIVRPGGGAFAIGRMFTSCSCIRLEADSRSFGPGERAALRLRNIIATPPAGQTYSFFVQIVEPIEATLRYDTYMQSSQFIPSPDGARPTRGNIIADGILIGDLPGPATDYSVSSAAPAAKPSVRPSVRIEGEADDSAAAAEGTGDSAGAGGLASADSAGLDGSTDFEIIVPKADGYIPDTSEYALRKKAEEAAADGGLSGGSAVPEKSVAASAAAPARVRVPVRMRPEARSAAAPQIQSARKEADAKKRESPDASATNAAGAAGAADDADSLWQEVRPRSPLQ